MAVIIPKMDMPESCYYCPLTSGGWHKDEGAWCNVLGKQLPAGSNAARCPVKSVDGLIAKIELERDRKLGGETFEIAQYKSFDKAVEIIKEYCK